MKGKDYFEWITKLDMEQIFEANEKIYEHVSEVDDIDEFNIRVFALIDKWMAEHDKTAEEAMEFLSELYGCSMQLYSTMGVLKKCSENLEQRM